MDLDLIGGNLGLVMFNVKVEFIGLLFDGMFESVNFDWDFDLKIICIIYVDSCYMLWVMEYVDGVINFIEEMIIVR